MSFTLYTADNAPQGSRDQLVQSARAFGWVPNLHAVLAEAPAVLEGYKALHDLFQKTSFDNEELTVVWQTINHENQCSYCIPAHTTIAHLMKVDKAIIDALNSGTPLPSDKLEVLRKTTLALLRHRGRLPEQVLKDFHNAGYGNQQILEILLGIAQKTISNYTNHLADTPLDEAFSAHN